MQEARQHATRNDMGAARQAYFRLIRDHPSSRLVPYAYLAFAEYFFDRGDLAAAEQLDERILAFTDSMAGIARVEAAFVAVAADNDLDGDVRVVEPRNAGAKVLPAAL